MARHEGVCIGCGEFMQFQRHHIRPARFYGRGKDNDHICLLCETCHMQLETRIPQEQCLQDWEYFAIIARFLKQKEEYNALSR